MSAMFANWMQWLEVNKGPLSLILSAIALLVSIFALLRTAQRDRRAIREELERTAPLITYSIEHAKNVELFIPEHRSSIPGWDFYLHLAIENRSNTSFTVERVAGVEPRGETVRLHTPVSEGLKCPSRENPKDHLIGNRFHSSFKPISPKGV